MMTQWQIPVISDSSWKPIPAAPDDEMCAGRQLLIHTHTHMQACTSIPTYPCLRKTAYFCYSLSYKPEQIRRGCGRKVSRFGTFRPLEAANKNTLWLLCVHVLFFTTCLCFPAIVLFHLLVNESCN